MCLLKKNAVIFKVGYDVTDPIVVIQQKLFTNEEPDSCVPLLGIYDGTHYQSVFPAEGVIVRKSGLNVLVNSLVKLV